MVEQEAGQGENRVDGRPKLVTHVGEKAAFQVIDAPQMLGLLIQLGVERHHATVGVLQLAIEPEEVVLPGAQGLERLEQLLVLLLDFHQRVLWPLLGQRLDELVQARSGPQRGGAGEELLQAHDRALARCGRDVDLIHEVVGATQAQAQAGRRLVLARRGSPAGGESPAPASLTTICRSCGGVWPSRWNATLPPPA